MKTFPLSLFALILACCLSGSKNLYAQTVYALSGDKLVAFDASAPAVLSQSTTISGLLAGSSLVGLDFRPATGQLYALGYNAVSGATVLYTIDRNTGVATQVGNAPLSLNANVGNFGFDFNPTVDRIRVTGSDGSNYRLHPVTGALAATDGNLAFAAADANATASPNIVASAYTNSYIGATSTTLYNFDASLNILVTQAPPNNGTLNTVGGSGLSLNDMDQSVDIDITTDGVTGNNVAFMAANTDLSPNDALYRLNLGAGAATLIGNIGGGIPVRDIAVLIERNVPATIGGTLLYALTSGNNLISFDSKLPSVLRSLVAVSGITAGQTIVGLDSRPATGELYAMGYNASNGETRLYTLNAATGAATPVGTSAINLAAGMGKVSMDFNPTVDRIRVTGSNNANYRLHPVTGAIAATDLNLAFAGPNAGIDPSIGAVAYSNSFNGATATTLFNYDDSLNVLTTQMPPNNGTLNTIGSGGITVNLADPSTDLDIYFDQASAQNIAFMTANVDAETSDNLYMVNLSTGMTTLVGRIGQGIAVTDLAAAIVIAPAETACDDHTAGCARFELISVRRDASGDEIYRIRVTNTCASALNYVAFGLPDGVSPLSPSDASGYTAPSTRTYAVRSPGFSPFYSVRFKATGAGIVSNQQDIFEYKLPKQADQAHIHAFVRTMDGAGYEAYLNTANCPTQAFISSKMERNGEAGLISGDEMILYPNPTSGLLFVDLSSLSGQQVGLTVYSPAGSVLLRQAVNDAEGATPLELPASLANGLYLLEMQAADGTRRLRRFVVLR